MEDMLVCGTAGHYMTMIDGLDREKEKIGVQGLIDGGYMGRGFVYEGLEPDGWAFWA